MRKVTQLNDVRIKSDWAIYHCASEDISDYEESEIINYTKKTHFAYPTKRYYDTDPSVPLDDREAITALINDCSNGTITRIILYSPDGISDSWSDVEKFIHVFDEMHVPIDFALQEINSTQMSFNSFLSRVALFHEDGRHERFQLPSSDHDFH